MAEKVVIGNAELWHGDCLEILPHISKAEVVITDPPYGTKTDQRDTFMVGEFSNIMPLALPLIHQAMSDDGAFYCFTSWSMMADWLIRYQQFFKLQNILIWDKQRHSGCYSSQSWQFTWEGVFFGLKGKRKIRNYARDVLVSRETGKRIAMQKPVDIIVSMIEASSDTGGLVCDPFLGSGSTGVAAVSSGRRFVGCEINRKMFDIACERIAGAQSAGQLLQPEPVQGEPPLVVADLDDDDL